MAGGLPGSRACRTGGERQIEAKYAQRIESTDRFETPKEVGSGKPRATPAHVPPFLFSAGVQDRVRGNASLL